MSSKSLRASITFVDLHTSVAHVVPVVKVGHVLMTVSAAMDTSGRYRYIQDVTIVADAAAITLSKPFTDSIDLATDAQTLEVGKALSDSVGFSDAVVAMLIFIRDFADSTSISDAKALVVSPAYVEDVIATDTLAFSHAKAFADGFAMNDMADAGGPVWSFSDTTANIITMSDSSLLASDKGVVDSIVVSDSGVLSMQDYCDLTYFSEDYVGTSRTF